MHKYTDASSVVGHLFFFNISKYVKGEDDRGGAPCGHAAKSLGRQDRYESDFRAARTSESVKALHGDEMR